MIRHEFSAFARFLTACAAASCMASLAACGGASPDAKSPAASSSTREQEATVPPTTVEEAEQQIAAAKAELGRATDASGASLVESPKTGSSAAPTAPMEPPRTSDSRPPRASGGPSTESQHSAGARKAGPGGNDRCASPCRALASMRRAVDALCRMTAGSDDTRCRDAKRTLEDSERLIKACAC